MRSKMKKSDKKLTKRDIRKKYKHYVKTAEDIFELNSPQGVNLLESKLSNDMEEIAKKMKDYVVNSEDFITGLLPYVIYYLDSINSLKVKLPLNNNINNNKIKNYFNDLLRFEKEFGFIENLDNFGDLEYSIDKISNIQIISSIPLINIEAIVEKICTIDLSFDLPKFIFGRKDHINYIYFIKRGGIIYEIYNKLDKLINDSRILSEISINNLKDVINKCEYLDLNKKKNISISKDMIKDINIKLEYLNDLRYVPIISILFNLKSEYKINNATILLYKFRIIPNLLDDSNINKDNISIYRNNVRKSVSSIDNWSYNDLNSCFLPPTPQYNGALYNEFLNNRLKNKEIIDTILSSNLLNNVLILLKIWCIRWKIWNIKQDSRFRLVGQFNQETLIYLIYHCYKLNESTILTGRLSLFQFFKLILMTLYKMILNWKSSESGIHYILGKSSPKNFDRIFNNENDFKKTNLLHLFNRDYINQQLFILYDNNYNYNVFWRCQDIMKNEIEYILNKTLYIIDNKLMLDYNKSLYELFDIEMAYNYNINNIPYNISLLEFDCCCLINYPNTYYKINLSTNISDNNNENKMITLGNSNDPNVSKRLFYKIWENCESYNLLDIVRRIIKRSFTDRIKYVTLKEILSEDNFGCLIGIKFTSEITRSIDKGPAINTIEAQNFREFWGNKVETRKFKDGRVLETLIWDNNNNHHHHQEFINNSGINEHILKYTLSNHLPDISFDSKNELITYSMTPFGSINIHNMKEKLIYEEFLNFKNKILNLTSLPLNIKTIYTSSSILRFMKYFYFINQNDDELQIEEIPCIIEMEQSNKWPKTKESIKKIKIAFLLSIKKEINELYSIYSDIIPEYNLKNYDIKGLSPFLDIYWSNNITFRISIFHPCEFIQIAKNTIEIENFTEKIIQNNIIHKNYDDIIQFRNIWWKNQLSIRLMNLNNYFPSLRETIKKLKQFASIHKIPDTEELIEHIATYVYTNNDLINNIYEPPNTPTTGFIRSIWLLSNYQWNNKPLIVDLNYQIDENNNKTTINMDHYHKLDQIHSIYYNYIKKHNLSKPYFYISTLIDPQSILIKLPTNYNSHRLIHFAKLYLKLIINHSFDIPIHQFKNSLYIQPKSDILIILNQDFNKLIQPKYKQHKSNLFLKKQYINLNTTHDLLNCSNIKANPSNISRELFQLLISEINHIWNNQVDIIYDPYILPYPNQIYLKFNPNHFYLNQLLNKNQAKFLPNCIIHSEYKYQLNHHQSINDQLIKDQPILVIPNIIQTIYTLWNNYNGYIKDIKFI